MSDWLYVLACVVVPGAWGVAMYYAFGALEKRRRRYRKEDAPPIDYSI